MRVSSWPPNVGAQVDQPNRGNFERPTATPRTATHMTWSSFALPAPIAAIVRCAPTVSPRTRSRSLTIRAHDAYVALQTARQRQHTDGFKATYRTRAGIEATISQGTRSSDLRRSRYVGFGKTRLLHLLIGAAINFMRLAAWVADVPHARTRRSAFAKLAPVPM
jgi:Transposase DDE domain